MSAVYFYDQPGERPFKAKYPIIWNVAEQVIAIKWQAFLLKKGKTWVYIPRSNCTKMYHLLVRRLGHLLREKGKSLKDLPNIPITAIEIVKCSPDEPEQGSP